MSALTLDFLRRTEPLTASEIEQVEAELKKILAPHLDRIPMNLATLVNFLHGGGSSDGFSTAKYHCLNDDHPLGARVGVLPGFAEVEGLYKPLHKEPVVGRSQRLMWGVGRGGNFLLLTIFVHGRHESDAPHKGLRECAERVEIEEVSLATLMDRTNLSCHAIVSSLRVEVDEWAKKRRKAAEAAEVAAGAMYMLSTSLSGIR